jgi:hypothetical protein
LEYKRYGDVNNHAHQKTGLRFARQIPVNEDQVNEREDVGFEHHRNHHDQQAQCFIDELHSFEETCLVLSIDVLF